MNYLIFSAIFIISLLTLLPSFNLAIYGDTWLSFWRYIQHLGPKSSGEWNNLTFLLTPYGAQEILVGNLQKIFGYESMYYYILSFFLRILAAFSFYPLVFYLTKNKFATFFAVLFFSVTTIGLDTTDWVYNMTSYITIALFNLFLFLFLRSREKKNFKIFSLACFLYYLSYIIAPVRMHGSILLIFLLEFLWVLQKRNSETVKKTFFRLLAIVAIFLFIRFSGQTMGPSTEPIERFTQGINIATQLLTQGRFDFLFYPILMLGSLIVPDFILPNSQVSSWINLFFILLPFFLLYLVISFFLIKEITYNQFKNFKKIAILGLTWTIIVAIIHATNLNTFSDSRNIVLLLVGGYILILTFSFIIKFYRQTIISGGLFLGLVWSILSFFFAWWYLPISIFPTTYRYFIVSAQGISILLAVLISLGKEKKHQLTLLTLFSLLLIVNIISIRIYLNFLLNSHGQEVSNKIWSSLPSVPEIGKSKEPIIFYFEGDPGTENIIHDVLYFGLPPHIALLYNLREENGSLPIPMTKWEELISAITDGRTMPLYGQPVHPIPVNKIYAFYLKVSPLTLINVTVLAREKLTQIKSQSESK